VRSVLSYVGGKECDGIITHAMGSGSHAKKRKPNLSKDEMPQDAALQVGFLCYPRLTQLDLTGPYEVLVRMPNTKARVLWKDTIPVSTEDGLRIVANCSLADAPKLDVIVVPGGLGQQDLNGRPTGLGFSPNAGGKRTVRILCVYGFIAPRGCRTSDGLSSYVSLDVSPLAGAIGSDSHC
jgi:hypothetical protein